MLYLKVTDQEANNHLDYWGCGDASTTSPPVIREKKSLVGVAAIRVHDFTTELHHLNGACGSISPYVSMFGIIWEMGLSSM